MKTTVKCEEGDIKRYNNADQMKPGVLYYHYEPGRDDYARNVLHTRFGPVVLTLGDNDIHSNLVSHLLQEGWKFFPAAVGSVANIRLEQD